MVRKRLLSFLFHFFHGVVQEKVDQNGIDVGFRVFPLDLPPDQLYTPDATCCRLLADCPSSSMV